MRVTPISQGPVALHFEGGELAGNPKLMNELSEATPMVISPPHWEPASVSFTLRLLFAMLSPVAQTAQGEYPVLTPAAFMTIGEGAWVGAVVGAEVGVFVGTEVGGVVGTDVGTGEGTGVEFEPETVTFQLKKSLGVVVPLKVNPTALRESDDTQTISYGLLLVT